MRAGRRRRHYLAGLAPGKSESVRPGPGTGEYASRWICGRNLDIMSCAVAPKDEKGCKRSDLVNNLLKPDIDLVVSVK